MTSSSESAVSVLLMALSSASFTGESREGVIQIAQEATTSFRKARGDRYSALVDRIVECIPTAALLPGTSVVKQRYRVKGKHGDVYEFDWGFGLDRGTYNHVHRAENVTVNGRPRTKSRAVVRRALRLDDYAREYFTETVIHAIINGLPNTESFVPELYAPLRIRHDIYPKFSVCTLCEQMAAGDLTHLLDEESPAAANLTDGAMFSIMAQLCAMLVVLQRDLTFQHRDLKPDNVATSLIHKATTHTYTSLPGVEIPSHGFRAVFIDFGMARIELEDVYIASDCVGAASPTTFNPSHDMQMLLAILAEDYLLSKERSAKFYKKFPKFAAWLDTATRKILKKIEVVKRKTKAGASASASAHRITCNTCAAQQLPDYHPQTLLNSLLEAMPK